MTPRSVGPFVVGVLTLAQITWAQTVPSSPAEPPSSDLGPIASVAPASSGEPPSDATASPAESAVPPPESSAEPASAVPTTPPAAAAPPEGVHRGFFSRAGIGFGSLTTSSEKREGSTQASFAAGGPALAFEASIGGSPIPGIVFGIGLYGVSFDVRESNRSGLMLGRGPFLDVYPDPKKGLHFETALLYNSITFRLNPTSCPVPTGCDLLDYSGSGYGLMVGAGWEGWVRPKFSVGLLLRAQYFSSTLRPDPRTTTPDPSYPSITVEHPDAAVSVVIPTALIVATYY